MAVSHVCVRGGEGEGEGEGVVRVKADSNQRVGVLMPMQASRTFLFRLIELTAESKVSASASHRSPFLPCRTSPPLLSSPLLTCCTCVDV